MTIDITEGFSALIFYCVTICKDKPLHSIPKLTDVSTEFLQWFSGFTDAEGNFLINLDRHYVRFRFKISLHIDDIEVLEKIKSELGVGSITIENKQYCSFVVQDIDSIKDIIIPIFKSFPLQTNKRLDFNDFYEAIIMREKGKKLTDSERDKILLIKNKMNSQRVASYSASGESLNSVGASIAAADSVSINSCWLVGFIEGDGTFGIKNGSPYFQIAQKDSSQSTLNAIKIYIESLPNIHEQTIKLLPPNVTSATNKNTNVISLVVNSIDSLYYYILPMLEASKMYSRKAQDFKLWRVALLLHKKGYYFLPEGRQLFVEISKNINKLRYSTLKTSDGLNPNNSKILDDLLSRSQEIFAKPSPFDLNLGKTHVELSQEFSRAKRKLNQNIVYIYKDNKLVEGSPFLKLSDAHRALGLSPSSKTCHRYLDTGKLYKNKYLFSSTPIITNE
jgi:hypothetical protein